MVSKEQIRNPMQLLVIEDGVIRFRENRIVRYLMDKGGVGLNELAVADFSMKFTQDDWEQFYQLIGYSVAGFHELGRVSDETAMMATKKSMRSFDLKVGCRSGGCDVHCGVERE